MFERYSVVDFLFLVTNLKSKPNFAQWDEQQTLSVETHGDESPITAQKEYDTTNRSINETSK